MNLDGSFREYVSNLNPPFYVINLTAFVVGISVAIAVAFLFLAWKVEQVRRLLAGVYEYMKEQVSNIFNKDTPVAVPPPPPPLSPQRPRSPSPLKIKRYLENKPTEVSHENLPQQQQLAKPIQQPPAQPGPQPTWPNDSSTTAIDLSAGKAKFSSKTDEKCATSDSDARAPEHYQSTTVGAVFEWVKRLTGLRSRRAPGDNEA